MTDVTFPVPPELPVVKKSKLAVVSLVLGVLSPCCFYFFTGIPAVICGHLALNKIKHSAGTLTGSGLAIAGLVLGYISFFSLFVVGILSGLAIPAITGVLDEAKLAASVSNVKSLGVLCVQYAAKHDGTYPSSLDELKDYGLSNNKILHSPLTDKRDSMPDYIILASGNELLICDTRVSKRYKRAVALVNEHGVAAWGMAADEFQNKNEFQKFFEND